MKRRVKENEAPNRTKLMQMMMRSSIKQLDVNARKQGLCFIHIIINHALAFAQACDVISSLQPSL